MEDGTAHSTLKTDSENKFVTVYAYSWVLKWNEKLLSRKLVQNGDSWVSEDRSMLRF